MSMPLQSLSDSDLLRSTRQAALREREATHQVLLHLLEVERRRLYLPKYASLFEFCLTELGLCAGSAQIRIAAMRLLRDIPAEEVRAQVFEKLDSGSLKLTQLSMIQKHSKTVKAEQGRKVAVAEKVALLNRLEGKSTRETEKIGTQTLQVKSDAT